MDASCNMLNCGIIPSKPVLINRRSARDEDSTFSNLDLVIEAKGSFFSWREQFSIEMRSMPTAFGNPCPRLFVTYGKMPTINGKVSLQRHIGRPIQINTRRSLPGCPRDGVRRMNIAA